MPRRERKSRTPATTLKSERLYGLERIYAGYSPTHADEGRQMKGILIAVTTVVLGTLAYITLGIALASVS